MTEDILVIESVANINNDAFAKAQHVHDTSGKCLKDRAGHCQVEVSNA